MLQFIRDKLAAIWQDRFLWGVGVQLGDINLSRYNNGAVSAAVHGPMIFSMGTGHWPWYLFEAVGQTGPAPSWHVGILGFCVGMFMEHDVNEGEIVGPDYRKYYWFFKGLNHQGKELEEII